MELSVMMKTRYARIAAVLAIENMIVQNSEISLLTSFVEFVEVPVIWLAIAPSTRILTLPLPQMDPHHPVTEQGLIQNTLI